MQEGIQAIDRLNEAILWRAEVVTAVDVVVIGIRGTWCRGGSSMGMCGGCVGIVSWPGTCT
jgi:hypothetical protein